MKCNQIKPCRRAGYRLCLGPAAALLGLIFVLSGGCGLSPGAGPSGRMPDGFQARAHPDAGPAAKELSRMLNKLQTGSGPASSRGQQLEITSLSLSSQLRDGYDLARRTVLGPPEAVTLVDPFKKQTYQVKRPRKTEETVELPYRLLAATVQVDYRLVDGSSGRLLAQGDCRLEEGFKYGGLLADQGLAPPLERAPRKLEDDPQAQEIMLTRLADRISREVAPAASGPAYVFDLGQDAQTAAGVRAAQAGDWPEARRIWTEVLEANPKYAPAHYNLGIAEENRGDDDGLSQARKHYKAAQLNGSRSIYREALTRVTARINELGLAIKADLSQK